MRKNTARHWLHATLDLLPVILIPVFMIYSHRHDLSTDITIQQDVYKDFYQGVKNGKPYNLNDIYDDDSGNVDLSMGEETYLEVGINEYAEVDYYFNMNMPINNNDKIFFSFDLGGEFNCNFDIEFYLSGNDDFTITTISNYTNFLYENVIHFVKYTYLITFNADSDIIERLDIYTINNNDFTSFLYYRNIEVFNLTTIFGSGNEPTQEVFESYLTQDYYDFGSNQVKVGTIDVQAKNNDIMSVFMDSFNNSVNKYFNMGNVFNLNNVYEWFNANLFGGNAPVVIYSVYNIVVYELVMDLLFLLYALFMWFIDMLKRLIEKPLDSIK